MGCASCPDELLAAVRLGGPGGARSKHSCERRVGATCSLGAGLLLRMRRNSLGAAVAAPCRPNPCLALERQSLPHSANRVGSANRVIMVAEETSRWRAGRSLSPDYRPLSRPLETAPASLKPSRTLLQTWQRNFCAAAAPLVVARRRKAVSAQSTVWSAGMPSLRPPRGETAPPAGHKVGGAANSKAPKSLAGCSRACK